MPKKNSTESKDQPAKKENIKTTNGNSREKRIMNAIVNTSIVLMGMLMGGFTELMVNVTGTVASGMAEAVGGEEAGEKVNKEFKEKVPEVNEKMKAMMSDMRKDMYAQIAQNIKEIEPFMSDPIFDIGPQKIDEYDFGILKLTEELDDGTLAQYSYLLVSEDATFAELFKQLTEWLNNLPKTPEKAKKKQTHTRTA